ncbi:hypothetical protein MJN51_41695, partial [Salmonella enterica subsp. enterica serovar Kentucky]|nr:hypothetical protein [Salmonella enterica subsp. enterica serovar Kentucky]
DIAVGFLVIPNVIALFLLRKEFISEFNIFRTRTQRDTNSEKTQKRDRASRALLRTY